MTSPLRHLKPAIILDCFEDFGDFHLIVCSEFQEALTHQIRSGQVLLVMKESTCARLLHLVVRRACLGQ
jgi:hypothetical protein